MKVNMASRPLLGSPMIQPVAPSKLSTAVAEDLMPILCSSAVQTTPLRAPREPAAFGMTLGTTKSEMPRGPLGASGRRASTMWMMFSARSCSPELMKILLP